ncbi:hypothetical protein FRC03_009685 [Tulasnella sp. 419]|nr:hypothetical protein FRC03_009685 [Tulasnella sp. 419]
MAVIEVVLGTNATMVELAGEAYRTDPEGLFGPWLIGNCFDWMFTGVMLFQAQTYFKLFPNDARWIKYLVIIVVILSCLKTFQGFMLIWTQMVARAGDWRTVAGGTWWIWIEPTASQLLSFAAEAFFVYRCFRLTNKNYFVLGGLVLAMVGVFITTIFLSIRLKLDPYYVPLMRTLAIPALSTNLAIDVFITCVVSYKLYTSKTGFHEETDSMLTRLLALTWETAFPPAISAILNQVFYVVMPNNVVYMFFNMLTPRLYVFSLLYTLNSRPYIRDPTKNSTSHEGTTSKDGMTRTKRATTVIPSGHHLSIIKRGKDHISGIGLDASIHVQTETIIHTAPATEYDRKRQSMDQSDLGHDNTKARQVLTIDGTPMEQSDADSWSIASSITGKKDTYQMYGISRQHDAV